MSLAIWSIAIIHGFFVLIVYEFTKNKIGIISAAIISAIVGIFTGNPIYILIDILCVIGATIYCWDDLEKDNKKTPQQIREKNEKTRLKRIKAEEDARNFDKALNKFLQGSIILITVSSLLFIIFQSKLNQTPINKNTNQQQSITQETTKSKTTPEKANSPNKTLPPKERKNDSSPKKHPVERCLEIRDENAMIRCLETTK